MKILILDDDIVGRKILMIMLKKFGNCDQGSSNEEGVLLFKQGIDTGQPYDLVFIDVDMRDEDGCHSIQVLRQIEEKYGILAVEGIKCIMICTTPPKNSSEDSEISDNINTYKLQWDGYLVKPVSPAILERELGRLKLIKPQLEIVNKRQLATLMLDVGDKEIVRELVIKFMAELPGKLLDMQKKVGKEQYYDIEKNGHQLASLSGTFGFSQLLGTLRSVEEGAGKREKHTVVDGLALSVKQGKETQRQLADFLADCEVYDGK